jgi:beta-lactamase class A
MRPPRHALALLAATVLVPLAGVAVAHAGGCGSSPLAATAPPQAPGGAWVIDLRTGCEWGWGRTDRQYAMASTAKVAVLGAALAAIDAGRLDATTVDTYARPMIEHSDNDATVVLWRLLGGSAGVAAYLRGLGLRSFTPWPSFGGYAMSPHDLAWLVNRVAGPASTLSAGLRDYARSEMRSVERSQRFGASAGVPAGWPVALKDGWYLIRPVDHGVAGRWRVSSAGIVSSPNGRARYVFSAMGDEWPSMAAGVTEIERASRAVAGALAK